MRFFGMEFPLLVKFVISFAVVLILIGAAAFLVRRFGARALIGTTQRGQQPRLAVVDTAAIDSRRSLVIVRRDNVEHLLLIGGPTDLLVEPNIARTAAGRDVEAPARASEPAAANWPTRGPIEPSPRFEPPVRNEPAFLPDLAQRTEPEVRIQPVPAFEPAPVASVPRSNIQFQNTQAPAASAQRDKLNGSAHQTQSESPPPRHAPEPAQIPADLPEVAASDDQSLANMAQRLETALRRPLGGALRATPAPARPATNQAQPAPEQPPPAPAAPPVAVPALDRARRKRVPLLRRRPPQAPPRRRLTKIFSAKWPVYWAASPGVREGAAYRPPSSSCDDSGRSSADHRDPCCRAGRQHQFRPGHRPHGTRHPAGGAAHGAVARALHSGDGDVVHAYRRRAVAPAHCAGHGHRTAQRRHHFARVVSDGIRDGAGIPARLRRRIKAHAQSTKSRPSRRSSARASRFAHSC